MINEKERIAILLKQLKLTKNALGKALGNNNGQIITNIEKGINGISPNFASRVTNIYPHISYDWLLNGQGDIVVKEYDLSNNFMEGTNEAPENYSAHQVVKGVDLLESALRDKDKIIELLELQVRNLRQELAKLKAGN